jgi:hypothetical protein
MAIVWYHVLWVRVEEVLVMFMFEVADFPFVFATSFSRLFYQVNLFLSIRCFHLHR